MQTEDFRRAYDAFVAKQKPRIRGRLNAAARSRMPISTGRSSTPRHRDARDASCDAWAARRSSHGGARARRATPSLPRRWCAARRRRAGCATACRAAHGGRAETIDSRADLPVARDARPATRPRRFRLRDAGPRQRRDRARRHRPRRSSASCRGSARGEAIAAFALSEPDAGSDVAAHDLRSARATATTTCSTARRPGSPTAASPISTSCSPAPARRRARAASRLSSSTPDTPGFEIAERIDVIAPHPLARSRFADCRIPGDAADRRAGRGLQGRDAHARHLPRLGRGGRARLRPPRPRRGARARATARTMFGQTLADFQLTQAALARHGDAIDAARAARPTAPPGCATCRAVAHDARSRHGEDGRDREARSA